MPVQEFVSLKSLWRERDQKRIGSRGGQSLAPSPPEEMKGPWQLGKLTTKVLISFLMWIFVGAALEVVLTDRNFSMFRNCGLTA